jgi:hypothetical protein
LRVEAYHKELGRNSPWKLCLQGKLADLILEIATPRVLEATTQVAFVRLLWCYDFIKGPFQSGIYFKSNLRISKFGPHKGFP